jgi:uncharacterized protein with GYD domain
MAKYLIRGSYTSEGVRGLMKDGGTGRLRAVENAAASVGGKVEAFYFAFGGDDVFVILDLPDAVSASALALKVGAAGTTTLSTTPLITPEEVDAAVKKAVSYTKPGG